VRTAGPVKTGDATNIILPVVLLGASAAAIGFALIKRKKI
jgi:LPXTG-motif cell wall-anchored protein